MNDSNKHREKIARMEQMLSQTLEQIERAEASLKHSESAAQIEEIKEKNGRRLESAENFQREMAEERSFL
ncbi:hypothetical protein [Bacillus xiapuensis]|uniref:hypothetical protein n=1 Tax=Bacillus xiapuensis TaxID=2014075 RepID=UPI000C231E3C|nr:hypothetical protein [Bacillus xiapuensis]